MEGNHSTPHSSNKKFIIIAFVVLIVVALGAGGYFFLNSSGSSSSDVDEEEMSNDNVKKVTADAIGLTLTPSQNNQVLLMEITKLDGISSIDYEVSYDAQENGETVPRGVIGSAEVEGGTIERKIDLGTCSRNVCKYDKGVEKVKVVIRINYSDGSVGEVEEEISL